MMQQQKSVNQLYKESGTTVPFKEFLKRYNESKQLNASGATGSDVTVLKTTENVNFQSVFQTPFKDFISGGSGSTDDSKVLGLNKTVVYVSAALILSAIIIYFVRQKLANEKK